MTLAAVRAIALIACFMAPCSARAEAPHAQRSAPGAPAPKIAARADEIVALSRAIDTGASTRELPGRSDQRAHEARPRAPARSEALVSAVAPSTRTSSAVALEQEPAPRDTAPLPREREASTPSRATPDERARAALERGLDWLAKEQARLSDGSFPPTGLRASRADVAAETEGHHAPVALTSLAALAFLAAGEQPDRGPRALALARALDWIAGRVELDTRSDHFGYASQPGDALSRMHGHGFAALALSQAFVASRKTARGARIETALEAAVRCIERSQGVEGGWWYDPKKGAQHENSITICAVQALRGAQNAGLAVEPLVVARALDYVERTQKPDGSFRYALGDERSSISLTAAAIATFEMLGRYEGKALAEGYDWLARALAMRGDGAAPSDVICPFYERLYVAQALWQSREEGVFDAWWKREMPRVVASQELDGRWKDPRYGDVYATAVNCLVLALPEGLLPIFQR